MRFATYLKRNFGEFLLVLASAWAVATVGLNAFYLDGLVEVLGYWGRAGASLCAVALLVLMLYAASFRRRSAIVGALFYLALCVLAVTAALSLSTGQDVYADAEGNYLYMALVLIGSATACFLLSRTLAGSAVWFVAAAFVCSAVQALYQPEELAMSVVATLAALALIVCRNFKLGLEQADQASMPSGAESFASSVVPVASVFAVALAAWFFVIAPLGPGVLDMKLITDYRSLPIEMLKGTAQEHPELNLEMTSDNLIDGFFYTTDDLKEDPTSSVTIDASSLLEQQMQQQLNGSTGDASSGSGSGQRQTLDEESLEPEYDPHSYSWMFPWVVAAIVAGALAVAAIVGYFVGRRVLRKRRLKKMLALEPADQVKGIYRFELGRLKRLGFDVPAGMTLAEWSKSSGRNMEILTEETRVSFDQLTGLYTACVYGKHVPTEDEVVPFAAYYLNFWRAARSQLGNFRYFFKSFRL